MEKVQIGLIRKDFKAGLAVQEDHRIFGNVVKRKQKRVKGKLKQKAQYEVEGTEVEAEEFETNDFYDMYFVTDGFFYIIRFYKY